MASVTSAFSTTTSSPTPALSPPPGVTSNFTHGDSLTKWSNLTIGICVPLVTVLYLLRCFVRIRYKKTWTIEDWLLTSSWVGTVAFCGILATTMAHHGGKHAWDITADQAKEVAYWFNVAAIEYAVTICMTKISILWLYRRAFSPRKGSVFDRTIYSLIASFIIFYGVTAFAKIFECSPRAKIFDSTVPGHCIKLFDVLVANGIFNTITDFIILLMPTVTVYNLQLTTKKKIVIVMIFTFGLCAPIFSIIGFYVRFKLGRNPDSSWNLPAILLWGTAEVTTGTMCVCFPELGLLFNQKSRPSKKPTQSILNGAKDAIARSARQRNGSSKADPFFVTRHTASDTELVDINPYLELEEDHGHRTNVSPAPGRRMGGIPEGSVHVQYDIHIESK